MGLYKIDPLLRNLISLVEKPLQIKTNERDYIHGKQSHPNRCATTVFGKKQVGDRLSVMGLLECAAWIDPNIFTGRMCGTKYDHSQIQGGSLEYTVKALFKQSHWGEEGFPANREEADKEVYDVVGESCARMGLCANCDRFVEGEPTILPDPDN